MTNRGYERALRFERFAGALFRAIGYEVDMDPKQFRFCYDLMISKDDKKYLVEVKLRASSRLFHVSKDLSETAKKNNALPMLFIGDKVNETVINEIMREDDGFVICDISNILYLVGDNNILMRELLSVIDFSITGISPKRPNSIIDVEEKKPNSLGKDDTIESLGERFKKWKPDEGNNTEYETLCNEALQVLFEDDLLFLGTQKRSNRGLYRFDQICRIKDRNTTDFWSMISMYYQSKYVVFEYKNYTTKITQKEVYTTDRYLFATALRRVAIIVSTEGTDKNADIAIGGVLRETGKLIISLSNEDIVKMLQGKMMGECPSEYLYSRLDRMMVHLDK